MLYSAVGLLNFSLSCPHVTSQLENEIFSSKLRIEDWLFNGNKVKTLFLKYLCYIIVNKSTEFTENVSIKPPHYYYRVIIGSNTYLVISPEGYFTGERIPKICTLTMGIKKCVRKAPTIYSHIPCMPMYIDRSRWLDVGHILLVRFYGPTRSRVSQNIFRTFRAPANKTGIIIWPVWPRARFHCKSIEKILVWGPTFRSKWVT